MDLPVAGRSFGHPAPPANEREPMLLAYDYPILGVLWTTVIIMFWVLWFILLFHIIGDVFRSKDLGGFAKTMWLLFVLFVPADKRTTF